MKTVIALFDAPLPAQAVLRQLASLGLGPWEVMTVPPPPTSGQPPGRENGPFEDQDSDSWLLGILKRSGVPDRDALAYLEGVHRGGILLIVRAPELTVPLVRQTIEAAAPPDLETHLARWATRPELRYDWQVVEPPILDPP